MCGERLASVTLTYCILWPGTAPVTYRTSKAWLIRSTYEYNYKIS